MYDKTQKWLKNINIELLNDVNDFVNSSASLKLLGMAEALHERDLGYCGDDSAAAAGPAGLADFRTVVFREDHLCPTLIDT